MYRDVIEYLEPIVMDGQNGPPPTPTPSPTPIPSPPDPPKEDEFNPGSGGG